MAEKIELLSAHVKYNIDRKITTRAAPPSSICDHLQRDFPLFQPKNLLDLKYRIELNIRNGVPITTYFSEFYS